MDEIFAHIKTIEDDPAVYESRMSGKGFANVDDICLKELDLPYTGRLFLGKRHTDVDMLWWMKHHQIKVVISMGFPETPWEELKKHNGEPYMDLRHTYNYDVEDLEDPVHVQRMARFLPQIGRQLCYHLSLGENVMVHCHWGMSRSATGILWFLTHMHDIPLLTAVKHVKSKRKIVYPKHAFLRLCMNPPLVVASIADNIPLSQ